MFLRSLRWQLQVWHAVLLVVVLAGFGATAWQLQRASRLRDIDRELDASALEILRFVRDNAPDRGRPPGPPSRRPRLPQDRDPSTRSPIYFIAWGRDGTEIERSAGAPTNAVRPAIFGEGSRRRPMHQTRGTFREGWHATPPGELILVGRSIAGELAELRQFGFALAVAGAAVLAAALAIGAWLAGRAMRPLHRIGTSARRIAAGSHSDRIDTTGLPEELAALAGVLNEGFVQIEETLVRQRQFTADASHELRTPVSVILAQSQTALARPRSEAEYRQSLEACQRAAQRMRRLVESLLTLTRLESGEEPLRPQGVDLNELAREAVEAVRPLAQESRIRLRFEPATPAITLNADPDKLGQVVLNLLGNAIAYNRPEGEVAVSTGIHGTEAFLRVTDTGIGIATEHLPKIFDRFYRVDPSRTNTRGHSGLGLAISARIMAQHGGRITVESEPGRGSTFTVWLATRSGGYLEPTPLAQANSPDSTVQSCPK